MAWPIRESRQKRKVGRWCSSDVRGSAGRANATFVESGLPKDDVPASLFLSLRHWSTNSIRVVGVILSARWPISQSKFSSLKMKQQPRSKLSFTICSLVISVFLFIDTARPADAQDEWKKIIDAAKKEGKIVAGGPPTATLRKQYQEAFEKKFGIELELVLAPGWQNAGRATAEFKAGVRYFDVLHGGSGTLEPLMHDNMLAVFSDYMVLPEVKDRGSGGAVICGKTTSKAIGSFIPSLRDSRCRPFLTPI